MVCSGNKNSLYIRTAAEHCTCCRDTDAAEHCTCCRDTDAAEHCTCCRDSDAASDDFVKMFDCIL